MRQSSGVGRVLVACAVVVAIGSISSHAQAKGWPQVQAVHVVRAISAPPDDMDTPFLVYIQDLQGTPVYKFECHSGNYPDDDEYDFSGDFQCVLFAYRDGKVASWNLLAASTKDELSTDWWNRGRMLSRQLRGKCLAYPEYSTERHFRLRGMLITVRFEDIAWGSGEDQQGNPQLAKFTLTLDVVPDKAAQGSRAELPTGPRPPTSCYP
jgi:hypothetical protein